MKWTSSYARRWRPLMSSHGRLGAGRLPSGTRSGMKCPGSSPLYGMSHWYRAR